MASEMEMTRVLGKLNLELFIEKFNMEKITPDLVGKLSLNEFEKLRVQNRDDIMASRVEGSKYGSEKPQRRKWNQCGAPQFNIPRAVLECYIDQNFKISEIGKILCVSKSTIYRRMRQYAMLPFLKLEIFLFFFFLTKISFKK